MNKLNSYIVLDSDIIVEACDKAIVFSESIRIKTMKNDIMYQKRKRNKKWIYYNLFIKKHISFSFLKKKIHFNYKEEFNKLEEKISYLLENGSIFSIFSNDNVVCKITMENCVRELNIIKKMALAAKETSFPKVYMSQDSFEMIERFIEKEKDSKMVYSIDKIAVEYNKIKQKIDDIKKRVNKGECVPQEEMDSIKKEIEDNEGEINKILDNFFGEINFI